MGGRAIKEIINQRIHFHMHSHLDGVTHTHFHSHARDNIEHQPKLHQHSHQNKRCGNERENEASFNCICDCLPDFLRIDGKIDTEFK